MDVRPKHILGGLKYFFDNAVIPLRSGSNIINLMDYFPLLKSGYASQQTIRNLMLVYTFHNTSKSYIFPDTLLTESFDGDIPSFHYFDSVQGLIEMQTAVESGLISSTCNTFKVMRILRLRFDSNCFYSGCLDDIAMLNTIPEFDALFRDKNFKVTLKNEEILSSNIHTIFYYIDNPITCRTITFSQLLEYSVNLDMDCLSKRLLADPRTNKLIYGTITRNLSIVEQYINDYDPRDNNLEVYHLSFRWSRYLHEKLRNKSVSNRIQAAIIERILLERAVFQIMMTSIGESDTPQSEELYRYSRSLLGF